MVIIAAELLKNADELVKQKTHPTSVISGYQISCKEAVHYISENLIINTDEIRRNGLINTAKIIRINGDFLANMVVDALLSIKYTDVRVQPLSPVNAINILKTHRRSQMESVLIMLNHVVGSQDMPMRIVNVKIT